MKYSVPLTLFAAVRTFVGGVNAGFTVILRSLICSHFVICLPFASSERTRHGLLLRDDDFYLHLTKIEIKTRLKLVALE